MDFLKESVQYVKGIGPKKAKILKKIGIEKIEDALLYFPREYEEWHEIKSISSISVGEEVSILASFQNKPSVLRPRKGMTIIKWNVRDASGKIECIWYNQPYRATAYIPDKIYFIHGKAEYKFGVFQMQNPLVEEYVPEKHDSAQIVPIYSLTEGISQKDIKRLVMETLEKTNNQIKDQIPLSIRQQFKLAEKNYALSQIHFPKSMLDLEEARRRLVFEELFFLQLALSKIHHQNQKQHHGIILAWSKEELDEFIQGLPFSLTDAQHRVLTEILEDLKSGKVMNRLVQGDVGSGKTILSVIALYCAYLSGYQGAMMVPTEILAEQHYQSFTQLLSHQGVRIECLTGSMKKSEKKRIKDDLCSGAVDIIIGTHSVIQEDILFKNLGLVVTDEQHRFGVRQRALLKEKGIDPHMLVMSATPIPRTLALIFYGDLDISVVDQLPPGRKPIKTFHVPTSMRSRVYDFIQKQVKEGRQVYMVCPLVEESEKVDSQSAVELFQELSQGPLAHLQLGLLHGRMKPSEKDEVMHEFVSGRIQVLVSTTVIEVGVNVPNATLMVIENAERFGLAQLHQLRGRVGRGSQQSYCILISDPKNKETKERMQIMVKSNDGFEISEKDLELRGPGDFLGVRQHGIPEFKIAKLPRDIPILKYAQTAAEKIMQDPNRDEYQNLMEFVSKEFGEKLSQITMN